MTHRASYWKTTAIVVRGRVILSWLRLAWAPDIGSATGSVGLIGFLLWRGFIAVCWSHAADSCACGVMLGKPRAKTDLFAAFATRLPTRGLLSRLGLQVSAGVAPASGRSRPGQAAE